MSIESVLPPNHLILCHPVLLLPSVFPSISVFSSELALPIRWPKYWSFSFSISPFNEYSGLISFRIDGSDLLAVQETLENLLQHHISNASVLWSSTLFIVQLSHLYMTTGKTIALNGSKIGPSTYSGEMGTQSRGGRAGEERVVTRDPLETKIKALTNRTKEVRLTLTFCLRWGGGEVGSDINMGSLKEEQVWGDDCELKQKDSQPDS